jgi:diketogulonate reductase-like aldo/keto reductase
MLPIPGTSSLKHLEENLAAASIHLAADDVNAIPELVPEDSRGSDIGATQLLRGKSMTGFNQR